MEQGANELDLRLGGEGREPVVAAARSPAAHPKIRQELR
jgi:hypothetical protein